MNINWDYLHDGCPKCGQHCGGECESENQVAPPESRNRRSKRVNQLRKEFLGWIDSRLANLTEQRQKAINDDNWMNAAGVAMQMDELTYVRSQFVLMSR